MLESCARCHAPLAEGALRYRARLTLWGDTGGVIACPTSQQVEQELNAALAAAVELDPQDAMDQVMEEVRFVVCTGCRGTLRRDPAGSGTAAPAATGWRQ